MFSAVVCVALLGILIIGLGFMVTVTRGNTNRLSGYKDDPEDRLYKVIRAHGNTVEYAPIVALLILYLGTTDPASWVVWTMWITTIARYLIAIGIIVSPTMDKPHPLRFIGALGTYLGGLVLCAAALLTVF